MLFLAILGFVIGGALLALGSYILKLGKSTQSWVPAKATILQKGTEISTASGPERRTHKYYVLYEYTVKGTTYKSDRISFKPAFKPTYQDRERFKGLKEITVYFNPLHPQQVVIERGIDGSNYRMIFAGVFFIGFAIFSLVWG